MTGILLVHSSAFGSGEVIKEVGRSLREPAFRFSDQADSCYSTQPRKSGLKVLFVRSALICM